MGRYSDSLIELIHHLTSSEKRYFKLHASLHRIGDGNKYVQLFDFIAKENPCDDETIRKSFKGAAFLNHLSVAKTRLYNQILHALGLFHSNQAIETTIWKKVQAADVLHSKSLDDQALALIQQAKRLAYRYEKHELGIYLINKEELLRRKINPDISNQFLNKLAQETASYVAFHRIKTLHNQLIPRIHDYLLHRRVTIAQEEKILLKELHSLCINHPSAASVTLAKHESVILLNIDNDKQKEAAALVNRSIETIQKYPALPLIEQQIRLHITGGILALDRSDKLAFQQHIISLNRLQQAIAKEASEWGPYLQNGIYFLELNAKHQRDKYRENDLLLNRTTNNWEKHRADVPYFLHCGLGLLLAEAWFVKGAYRKATAILNAIPENLQSNCMEGVFLSIQYQRIMIAVQTRDCAYLQHLLIQTRRYIRKLKNTHLFDLKIVDGIAKIAQSKTELDCSSRFEILLCTLNALQKKGVLSNKYAPLLRWVLVQSNKQQDFTTWRSVAL
jgi:hypothetical protein